MKKLLFSIALFFIALIYSNQLLAQLDLEMQIRPRAEFRNGYKMPRNFHSDPAFFIDQRSRLNAGLFLDSIEVYISLQDVRTWGDENQLQGNPSVGLHEAWVKWKVSRSFALKIGRQELAYDDQRLLGSVDWAQQARSHDALVMQWRPKQWQIDLGGAFNQSNASLFGTLYHQQNYKVLSYLWVHRNIGKDFNFSVTAISDGFQKYDSLATPVLFRHTAGSHLNYKFKNLKLKGGAWYQFGEDANHKEISAFMLNLEAAYALKQFTFTVGNDYLSGAIQTKQGLGTNYAFSTLYATNHKFYGHMDYFSNIPNDTKNHGLHDYFFKVGWKKGDWSAGLDVHYFLLAKQLYDKGELGTEIDLSTGYKINAFVQITAGYSIMNPAPLMVQIKGGTDDKLSHWAWIMLNVQPKWSFKKEK